MFSPVMPDEGSRERGGARRRRPRRCAQGATRGVGSAWCRSPHRAAGERAQRPPRSCSRGCCRRRVRPRGSARTLERRLGDAHHVVPGDDLLAAVVRREIDPPPGRMGSWALRERGQRVRRDVDRREVRGARRLVEVARLQPLRSAKAMEDHEVEAARASSCTRRRSRRCLPLPASQGKAGGWSPIFSTFGSARSFFSPGRWAKAPPAV